MYRADWCETWPTKSQPTDPGARWDAIGDRELPAFDHGEILGTALDRVRGKLWWSNIAVGILSEPFTMAEARDVYEAIADTTYDPSTFGRDLRATGLISSTKGQHRPTRGRPAALYTFADKEPSWGAGRRKRITG